MPHRVVAKRIVRVEQRQRPLRPGDGTAAPPARDGRAGMGSGASGDGVMSTRRKDELIDLWAKGRGLGSDGDNDRTARPTRPSPRRFLSRPSAEVSSAVAGSANDHAADASLSKSPMPLSPRSIDIVSARGRNKWTKHPGNVRLDELWSNSLEEYDALPKRGTGASSVGAITERTALFLRIVGALEGEGRRFLKLLPDGRFRLMSLREKTSKVQRQFHQKLRKK